MASQKRKESRSRAGELDKQVRVALAALQAGQGDVQEVFAQALARLEARAASRTKKKLRALSRDADATFSAALHDRLQEIDAVVAASHDQVVATCTASIERLEEVGGQHERRVADLAADTTEHITATRQALEAHTEELQAITADADGH